MISATLRRASAALAIMIDATACGGRTDAPLTPKDSSPDIRLRIDLTTPNANDGAVLFDIVGPAAVVASTYQGLLIDQDTETSNGVTTATVAVRGDLVSGAIGEIHVPRARGDAYTVRLRQVAAGARGGYANRTDLSAYRLTLRR